MWAHLNPDFAFFTKHFEVHEPLSQVNCDKQATMKNGKVYRRAGKLL